MSDAYEQYQRLVARVDAFGQGICQRYPTQITCHAGCDGCCISSSRCFLSRRITSHRQSLALTPKARQRLLARLHQDDPWRPVDTPPPCVLLEHGAVASTTIDR